MQIVYSIKECIQGYINNLFNVYLFIFAYLKCRETEMHRQRERESSHLMAHSQVPLTVSAKSGPKQKQATPFTSSKWVTVTQVPALVSCPTARNVVGSRYGPHKGWFSLLHSNHCTVVNSYQ